MKQLEKIQTLKDLAKHKRRVRFIQKQIYDFKRGINSTTNGHEWSRFKKLLAYWEDVLVEFELVDNLIIEDQNDFIEDFVPVPLVCHHCDGMGIHMSEDGEDYYDCICTDDRFNLENQNVCLECNGYGTYIPEYDHEFEDMPDPMDCDACDCTGRLGGKRS